MYHYVVINVCFSIHRNIYVKKNVIEKNIIPIFPQSKQNLHLEGMLDLGKLPRELVGVTQQNHMLGKRFWLKILNEIMNLVAIVLGTSKKLRNMKKRLWLSIE